MHLKFVVSQSKIMTLTFKNSYNPVKPIILGTPQALSIQQKFRFEMSEIPRSQWSGTFRLHSPYPSHRAFGYCSCKQDTKERYWEEQFCQMERDISVRPTDRNDQTGQSGSLSKLVPNIPVEPNRNGTFPLMYQPKLPEFWVKWKAPKKNTRRRPSL